jgi:hypothetical protein
MKCRYCNIALAPLRSLTDGEFCCDDHRYAFKEEQAARTEALFEPPQKTALFPVEIRFARILSPDIAPGCKLETRPFKSSIAIPCGEVLSLWSDPIVPDPSRLLAVPFSAVAKDLDTGFIEELPADLEFPGVIALPQCNLAPLSIPFEPQVEPEPERAWRLNPAPPEPIAEEPPSDIVHPYRDVAVSWHWIRDVWRNAPSDLKVVTVLLPILLALALSPWAPKIKVHFTPGSLRAIPTLKTLPALTSANVQQVVSDRLKNLHENILNRAAVDLTDDFRSGLDAWNSRSNLTSSWSYDAAGFVQPGPLALFKPSTDMTDYRMQFLGEIDQKGLGCAFRAANLDNYYALKLMVVKPGPLPLVRLVRYAVINGKEERHTEKPLPISTRPDTLYRIAVDVRGGDFTIMVQGQVVDFWSDNRIARGGVGFFCNKGEKARLRWVEVSHQYDALGRLCAYLAPYGIEGRNGNFN